MCAVSGTASDSTAVVVALVAYRVAGRVQRLALVASNGGKAGDERCVVLEAGRCPPNEGFAIRSQSFSGGFDSNFYEFFVEFGFNWWASMWLGVGGFESSECDVVVFIMSM